MSFHRMQVLHRSSWLPLGRCGPPLFSSHLTFGQLTCWVAISEVQIILNVRPCVCDATKLNACVRELLGQFIHRDGDPEGLFNILLLPWTLNGVAHGCEVVFLVHWLICFFFWWLRFAFLTDISGFASFVVPNLFQDHPFWAGVPLPSLPGTQECHSVLTYGWDCVAFAQRYMERTGMCKQRGPRNLPSQAAQASFQSVEERPWL